MSIYFADTSALAKRYIPETGSGWVQSWIGGHSIIISALTTVEFVSLLARRQREGSVSVAQFDQLRLDFLFHVRTQYHVIALQHDVLGEARRLLASAHWMRFNWPLRV